jgi:hypothetical protein
MLPTDKSLANSGDFGGSEEGAAVTEHDAERTLAIRSPRADYLRTTTACATFQAPPTRPRSEHHTDVCTRKRRRSKFTRRARHCEFQRRSAPPQGTVIRVPDIRKKIHSIAPVRKEFAIHSFRVKSRRFVDVAFLPDRSFRVASPDTLVCRCEEISSRQITDALSIVSGIGPNQLKSFLRCGMGACQGLLCGLTVTEIIAAHRGVSPSEVGHYRIRFPVKPITVAAVASLPHQPEDVRAVVRE